VQEAIDKSAEELMAAQAKEYEDDEQRDLEYAQMRLT
jgi:hypothetical protein